MAPICSYTPQAFFSRQLGSEFVDTSKGNDIQCGHLMMDSHFIDTSEVIGMQCAYPVLGSQVIDTSKGLDRRCVSPSMDSQFFDTSKAISTQCAYSTMGSQVIDTACYYTFCYAYAPQVMSGPDFKAPTPFCQTVAQAPAPCPCERQTQVPALCPSTLLLSQEQEKVQAQVQVQEPAQVQESVHVQEQVHVTAQVEEQVWMPAQVQATVQEQVQVQHSVAAEMPFACSERLEGMQGQVWTLACDKSGTLELQKALEGAKCDDERMLLAYQLCGHLWEAVDSKHANHFVEKCISTMRARNLQFIIDELLQAHPGAAVRLARHVHGCRIFQRLQEHCSYDQMREMVEELIANAVALCSDQYGNYAIQHILEHGTVDQKCRLAKILTENVSALGVPTHVSAKRTEWFGFAVVAKVFDYASQASTALARALVTEAGLFIKMASSRHGFQAAIQALLVLDVRERQCVCDELVPKIADLKADRYGKIVAAFVEKCRSERNYI